MKTALVKLRIEPTEHADWTRQAEAAGLSLSEWVRSRVNGEQTKPAAPTDKRTSRRNGGVVGAIENLTHDTLRKQPTAEPAPTFDPFLRKHHLRCPCAICHPPTSQLEARRRTLVEKLAQRATDEPIAAPDPQSVTPPRKPDSIAIAKAFGAPWFSGRGF